MNQKLKAVAGVVALVAAQVAVAGPVGYAGAVTGGGNATPISVSTMAQMQAAISAYSGTGGLVLKYTGKFDFSPIKANICGQWSKSKQEVAIPKSNITIIGEDGSAANFGLRIKGGASNIIIRNMTIGLLPGGASDGDAIGIEGASKVWIDHNELFTANQECPGTPGDDTTFDGLIEIKKDSTNITVSYNYIHDHDKVGLDGSSDSDSVVRRLTFHHNWYENVGQRVPLQRFGFTHILNNYFSKITVHGINVRMGGNSLIEGNFFENALNPVTARLSTSGGFWDLRNNNISSPADFGKYGITWDDCPSKDKCVKNASDWTTTKTFPDTLTYTYTADPALKVPCIVKAAAGAGKGLKESADVIGMCAGTPTTSSSSSVAVSSSPAVVSSSSSSKPVSSSASSKPVSQSSSSVAVKSSSSSASAQLGWVLGAKAGGTLTVPKGTGLAAYGNADSSGGAAKIVLTKQVGVGNSITCTAAAFGDASKKISSAECFYQVGSSASSSKPVSSSSSSKPVSSSSSSKSVVSSSSSVSSSIAVSSSSSSTPPVPVEAAIGYGAKASGGQGGEVVTVTSFAALQSAVSGTAPRIVKVQGTLTGTGMVKIGSNKTVLGVGSDATLDGFGLDVNGWSTEFGTANNSAACKPGVVGADGTKAVKWPDGSVKPFPISTNVVVRNLTFKNASDDALNVGCYSTHVWIDHNTINKPFDGSVDIKRGADFVTVSWNALVAADKAMLLGHETSSNQDIQSKGRLHVTYHHNSFENSVQRHPRVRYGTVHVYNNYGVSTQASYFVGVANDANIYVEANNFAGTNNACKDYENPSTSKVTFKSDNIILDRKGKALTCTTAASTGAAAPNYAYKLDSAANVPSVVKAGAGVGKIDTSVVTPPASSSSSSKAASSVATSQSPVISSSSSSKPVSSSSSSKPVASSSSSAHSSVGSNPVPGWTGPVNVCEAGALIFDTTVDCGGKSIGLKCDGGSETQPAVLTLINATIKNVRLAKGGGSDGIHCGWGSLGSGLGTNVQGGTCNLENVVWEEVCEDAASIGNGQKTTVMNIKGGSATNASDKVFQNNGIGSTLNVTGFATYGSVGKLSRSCGDCTGNGGPRYFNINGVTMEKVSSSVVGVNTNFGDKATIRNLKIKGYKSGSPKVCVEYTGVKDHQGSSKALGEAWGSTACDVSKGDVSAY